MTPPAAAMALLTQQEAPPIDPMERRILALEARIVVLIRLVENLAFKQAEQAEEVGDSLDRIFRALDRETEEEGV